MALAHKRARTRRHYAAPRLWIVGHCAVAGAEGLRGICGERQHSRSKGGTKWRRIWQLCAGCSRCGLAMRCARTHARGQIAVRVCIPHATDRARHRTHGDAHAIATRAHPPALSGRGTRELLRIRAEEQVREGAHALRRDSSSCERQFQHHGAVGANGCRCAVATCTRWDGRGQVATSCWVPNTVCR
jgi:hypothetical protein